MPRRHHRRLRRVRLPFLRERIGLHLVGLAVDPADAGLIHHRQPDIALGIKFEIEPALGLVGLQHRDRNVLHGAGLGIEHADELVAEVGVPGLAIGIDDHVVRHRLFARQIVFGDDDAGGPALRTRQALEVIFGRFGIAAAETGEIFRRGLGGVAGDDRPFAARTRQQRLRMGRRRARRIARHAQEHLLELGRAVGRRQHTLQGVAADALRQEGLLFVLARHADEPFAARQLRGQILDLAELEIGGGGGAGRDFSGLRSVEFVADRADRDRVVAGIEPVRRKAQRPCSLETTVTVTAEPAFLALTRTPSMADSSADETWPVSAADCACAGADPACSRAAPMLARNQRKPSRMTASPGRQFEGDVRSRHSDTG